MNIVVLDGYTLNPGDLDWSPLERLGTVTIHDRTGTDQALIVERAKEADAVLTNKTPLSAQTIHALPKLRYIGVMATGYNVVDVASAATRAIPVTNIPTYGTDSVAQMTFAHILTFSNRVVEHSREVVSGAWARSVDFCFWNAPLVELAGKTMGIIGFGRIGRRVGALADAFGMRVVAQDLRRTDAPNWPHFAWRRMDQLLAEADFVSLHCPLTPENTGMIDAGALRAMKRSAFLLNMSRGPLVVDADLADALRNGVIAGAGIDVLEREPPEADNPLYSAPNITITPHIAWATREARSRLLNTAVANVRAFLAGETANRVT